MDLTEAIQNPLLRDLYAHWEARRGGRRYPSRADFDPVELRALLGNIILIDVLREPLRFRFRLHGTRLAERVGYDLTGRMLDDLPDPEFREVARASFTAVAESGEPLIARRNRRLDSQRLRYETVMLPLSNDGRTVDMLLVALLYLDP